MQGRDVILILGAIVLVVLLLALLGGGAMWGLMGPGMMGWGGWVPWMGVLMVLFWLLAIGGIVLLVAWLLRQGPPATSGSRSLDILRERYARGEIDREQYERMRRDLEER